MPNKIPCGRIVLSALPLLCAASLEAQVARVFVSVNGNDANVCSDIATPCRTFGGGISQVDPNGEVIVIDSGSYAGATINKPVKLNVAAGAVAFSGLPIVVNVGPSQVVVLRGLTLKAATPGIGIGITLNGGTLVVEKTVIDGWDNGIVLNAVPGSRAVVNDTTIRNCASLGIYLQSGVKATVENARVLNGATWGIGAAGGSKVLVSRTEVAGNVQNGIYSVGTGTVVDVQKSRIYGSLEGLSVGAGNTLRVSQSVVTGNIFGLVANGVGAVLETYGNNVVRGNSIELSGTITTVSTQ
jgi:hypothetical protein